LRARSGAKQGKIKILVVVKPKGEKWCGDVNPPRASKRSHGDRMLSHKAVARMAVSIVTTALANGERSLTDSRWSRLFENVEVDLGPWHRAKRR